MSVARDGQSFAIGRSSTTPLQLSSMLLQVSVAPGRMLALPSLQSELLVTQPAGCVQARVVTPLLP